eukprot:3537931-Rhodomonas_salina.3
MVAQYRTPRGTSTSSICECNSSIRECSRSLGPYGSSVPHTDHMVAQYRTPHSSIGGCSSSIGEQRRSLRA